MNAPELDPPPPWGYAGILSKIYAARPPCQRGFFVSAICADQWRDGDWGIKYLCGNTWPGVIDAESESCHPSNISGGFPLKSMEIIMNDKTPRNSTPSSAYSSLYCLLERAAPPEIQTNGNPTQPQQDVTPAELAALADNADTLLVVFANGIRAVNLLMLYTDQINVTDDVRQSINDLVITLAEGQLALINLKQAAIDSKPTDLPPTGGEK